MATISTSKVVLSKGKLGAKRPQSPILLKAKHRSRLEERIDTQLTQAGIKFSYESEKINYVIPERQAKYTPDFIVTKLDGGKMYIEAKGYFHKLDERQKLERVKKQYPTIDLRIVFQDASKSIYKGSPTSYAKWAESHGLPWATGGIIPQLWFKEAI